MWCKFLRNIPQKVDVLSIIICKGTFLKACGSLKSGAAPTHINSKTKMNHVANQLIFKIVISVQKLSILIPKFKDFKNIFKQGFAHCLKISGHTCIIQSRKTAVPSLREARGPCPPNDCLCPPILVYFVFF